jgi:hypothetical protein
MKFWLIAMCALSIIVFTQSPIYGANRIGTNLEGINDYSADWPFVDRMKNSREWITFDATGKDTTWDTKIPVPSDDNGYPLEIPFDPDGAGPIPPQGVRTILYNSFTQYPAGIYTVRFEGKGRIQFRVDASCPDLPDGQCIFSTPNVSHHFQVIKPTKSGIRLKILESDPSDRIRNIRVIMPGFEESYDAQPFHPIFLERLRGFKYLRFMDWFSTNHSEVVEWNDRVKVGHYTFAKKGSGVPIEYMIRLCNELNVDMWINIPHLADNNYVAQCAKLIDSALEKGLKIYIEHSNEIWNTIFPQRKYAQLKGTELYADMFGGTISPDLAIAYWNSRRSGEIFQIFEQNLNANRHLIKVVAGQGVNPWRLEKILEGLNDEKINPTGVKADSIAIALYFGSSAADDLLTKDGSISKSAVVVDDIAKITIAQILDKSQKELEGIRTTGIIGHKKLADIYGVSLIAYEGGQSLYVGTGFSSAIVNAMTDKLFAANRHPDIGYLYQQMFDVWFNNGGTDFTNFSYIYRPQRAGMWGLLEYQSQPITEAYKYQAVMEIIQTPDTNPNNQQPDRPMNLRIMN